METREGSSTPLPACRSLLFPLEADAGRRSEIPLEPSDRSLFCLLLRGAMKSLVLMFPFLGWWRSLAASVTGLMTGKELSSGAGCRAEVCDAHWLRTSLAGQLQEDGLGVEVFACALSGNLLWVLCRVGC